MDKEYLKRVGVYVAMALLSILVIVYVVYHIINSFSNDIIFEEAKYTVSDEKVISDGYIFRDETVLYTSFDGILNSYFEEGEHVKAHSEVACVYSGTYSDVSEQLKVIDKKLDILKKSNVSLGAEAYDTKYTDKQINQLYYLICEKISQGDFEYAGEKSKELLVLLNKREIITNKRLNFNNEISVYESKRQSLVGNGDVPSDTVKTKIPGYYYSTTDGYETVFTVQSLENMTVDEFKVLSTSSPVKNSGQGRYAAGKIAGSHDWYIVCTVDKMTASEFEQDSLYGIYFPYEAGMTIEFTLERTVSTPKDEESLLIFKTDTVPSGFSFERRQNIEITYKATEGIKIPSDALHLSNGEHGVYILDNNVIRFIKTDIIYEGDGYYISKTDYGEGDTERHLREHDRIILGGKELYDGRTVG